MKNYFHLEKCDNSCIKAILQHQRQPTQPFQDATRRAPDGWDCARFWSCSELEQFSLQIATQKTEHDSSKKRIEKPWHWDWEIPQRKIGGDGWNCYK